MEATDQPNETKILVHADDAQIQRITEETTIRKQLLNDLLEAGIREYEIPDLSQDYIEKSIWDKHLQSSKPMSLEFSNGKKQKYLQEAYTLPDNLIHLKRIMEQWVNYPVQYRGFDKFRHLKLTDGRYQLDEESLEKEFVISRFKIYIDATAMDDIRELSGIRDHVVKNHFPLHRFLADPYWAERFTRDDSQAANRLPPGKLLFRKRYLMQETLVGQE